MDVSPSRFLSFRFTGDLDHVKPAVGKQKLRGENYCVRSNICCMPGPLLLTRFCKEQTSLNCIAEPGCFQEQCFHSDLQNQQDNLLAWLRFPPPGQWGTKRILCLKCHSHSQGSKRSPSTVSNSDTADTKVPVSSCCRYLHQDVILQKKRN